MLDIDGRIAMTVSCRDCDGIEKVASAGAISFRGNERVQVMHNGIEVLAGGYHGDWMEKIIADLHGHHEPQEELAFHALLSHCRSGSLMIELGSFWAYYTLWYLRKVEGSSAICVEPDPVNMLVGKKNAALNNCVERIQFVEAWIGEFAAPVHVAVGESAMKPITLPCLEMKTVASMASGREIELLHIDAQGAELGFVRSMGEASSLVRFLVVSTHHEQISRSPTTHLDCLNEIERWGGAILCEHSVEESFSGDGLIVASFRAGDRGIPIPKISRNNAETSLFGVG